MKMPVSHLSIPAFIPSANCSNSSGRSKGGSTKTRPRRIGRGQKGDQRFVAVSAVHRGPTIIPEVRV